ncbi:MAG: ribonuclease P protein component [Actinomycetaceae bacterium]|nr:ribonuclease P protein component [Actinomycetaceae bacterium]
MLGREHRLRQPELFRAAIRKGKRAGNLELVVHVWTGEATTQGRLVGFVVPKKVFRRATDRNRAKRRLRHFMRERLQILPDNSITVVRVLPGLTDPSSPTLETSLDDALRRALRKIERMKEVA